MLYHVLSRLQVDYPEIAEGVLPKHRFMSAYEQRVEGPDRGFQYLLFAAEPYETIGFKVSGLVTMAVLGSVQFGLPRTPWRAPAAVLPMISTLWTLSSPLTPYLTCLQLQSLEVDKAPDKLWTRWDGDGKRFFMQMQFKVSNRCMHWFDLLAC